MDAMIDSRSTNTTISQPNSWREEATAGWFVGITGKINESVSEPSAASIKALSSTSRAPQISRNEGGKDPTNADYVSPSTRNSPPSQNA